MSNGLLSLADSGASDVPDVRQEQVVRTSKPDARFEQAEQVQSALASIGQVASRVTAFCDANLWNDSVAKEARKEKKGSGLGWKMDGLRAGVQGSNGCSLGFTRQNTLDVSWKGTKIQLATHGSSLADIWIHGADGPFPISVMGAKAGMQRIGNQRFHVVTEAMQRDLDRRVTDAKADAKVKMQQRGVFAKLLSGGRAPSYVIPAEKTPTPDLYEMGIRVVKEAEEALLAAEEALREFLGDSVSAQTGPLSPDTAPDASAPVSGMVPIRNQESAIVQPADAPPARQNPNGRSDVLR